MKRLRQPVRAIREPFGKAGLVVAVVALVFAMLGGAYAANHTGGKATASAKAKKGPRGPKGPAGPEGKQGPAGANGKDGTNGTNGAPGEKGANGTSATTTAIPTSSATCNHNGGVEVKSASPTQNVCNGTTGFTKTLPSGQTETGSWTSQVFEAETESSHAWAPVSFSIPLAESSPDTENEGCTEGEGRTRECHVHYINSHGEEVLPQGVGTIEASNDCPGTAEEPLAGPGNLCIYEGAKVSVPENDTLQYLNFSSPATDLREPSSMGVSGGTLALQLNAEEGPPVQVYVRGSWAVTAP